MYTEAPTQAISDISNKKTLFYPIVFDMCVLRVFFIVANPLKFILHYKFNNKLG